MDLPSPPHGKQALYEVVVDDSLEPTGWWPVEAVDVRPNLDKATVPTLHLQRRVGEYANDINYEMSDGDGGSVRVEFSNVWEFFAAPLTFPPDEHRRIRR